MPGDPVGAEDDEDVEISKSSPYHILTIAELMQVEGVSRELLYGPDDTSFDNPKTLAAFALGMMLFLVTLGINVLAIRIVHKYREAYD